MSAKIMLIHPEGNFRNNPSLFGIIECLAESDFLVDVYCAQRPEVDQSFPDSRVRVLALPPAENKDELPEYTVMLQSPSDNPIEDYRELVVSNIEKYDLVIGVDRGIVEGNVIATIQQIPLGLISYEIWFERETSADFKKAEREASQNLAFAVCQDHVRATLLSIENDIPPHKIIHIPVAGRKLQVQDKAFRLHDKLGIPHSDNIALYMGDLTSAWTGIYAMLPKILELPPQWHLVLHHRYGQERMKPIQDFIDQKGAERIRLSPYPSLPFEQLPELLRDADLGVVFYVPVPNDITANDNLRFIGMASGKASTYLQHGVPLLINEIGEMSDYVRQYDLGEVVSDFDDISPGLARFGERALPSIKDHCRQFFEDYLSLDRHIEPFLRRVHECTSTRTRVE